MTDAELIAIAARSIKGKPNLGWNPLENDADAFRLMIDCDMVVYQPGGHLNDVMVEWAYSMAARGDIHEPCGADIYHDTRRAIVRAAVDYFLAKGKANDSQ